MSKIVDINKHNQNMYINKLIFIYSWYTARWYLLIRCLLIEVTINTKNYTERGKQL